MRHKYCGHNLGQWIGDQRKAQDIMSPERKQRLDDIGFVWDAIAGQWEDGFSKLLEFKEREGHAECRSGTSWMNLVLELGFVHKEKLKTACPLNVDRD
jgi:hypothetical protein